MIRALIGLCFCQNRSLSFFESRSLFFRKSEFVFIENRSMLFQSLFLTLALDSAHLTYHEVSTKMANSQVTEDSCKKVSACQD